MATIIMTISNDKIIPQAEIDRHRANYSNNRDAFVVQYTDAFIPNGYVITKDDNLVEHIKDIDKSGIDIKREIYKQAQHIKDGAKYSRDSSVLKGEKPYEPKKP
uniref:Uncharacterized protein n=1 Tax=viral metagenome TaxID=1070528 RepID=A0A6H1ZD70_9ZZZZ